MPALQSIIFILTEYYVLSRDPSDFLQDGLLTLILQGIENLLHDSQKSRYLQRKIKPFEVILQVFSSISAQYLLNARGVPTANQRQWY